MRYEKDESVWLLGAFDHGDTVTIDIYALSNDTKVVDGESCTEIGNTGIFKYNFSYDVENKEEFLWIMTNGSYTRQGKIVIGGYMDDIGGLFDAIADHRDAVEGKITLILTKVSKGKWRVVKINCRN